MDQLLSRCIPVLYSARQAAKNPGAYSPSAGKPTIVATALADRGFPVSFCAPRPVLFAEFCRAHSSAYVEGILSCREQNGFGNRDKAVAASLPYTSGSMLGAALAARPKMPACSLTSGFHHAMWDNGGGFCTLNGLMVTAAALLETGKAERVAILDLDAHYGNGTDDILRHRADLAPSIIHRTMGGSGSKHGAYLRKLREFLTEIEKFEPTIILYQAGADPHEDDPLGGHISTEEMRERDRLVFEFAEGAGIPLAWNLAGGYQKGGVTGIDPVLALHLNTFREACRAYGLPIPAEMAVPASARSRSSWWDEPEDDVPMLRGPERSKESCREVGRRYSQRNLFSDKW